MVDSVRITLTADISDLQSGLSQAAAGVNATVETMRTGASQVATSFGDLQRAYAAGVAQRLSLVKGESDDEMAIARAGDRAQTDIALDAIKLKQDQVKESAQLDQTSHADELAQLLVLESEREAVEARHLAFLQQTYQDNLAQYANVQRQIDELAAQSALKRQQIEATYARQVYADYKSSFDQIASSASTQIGQLIQGQETLRQAVANVLLSIVESFIQARLKAVADWAAGVVAETAATQAGEAAKTSAVVAGSAARTSASETGALASAATTIASIARSIVASAAETFAGIFGFLAPVLGPAAAGPAAAGQATVLAAGAALPSFDTGAWDLPADMVALVHRGEMIVPAGVAGQIRDGAGGGGAVSVTHHAHFNVTAMDARSVGRFFRDNGKTILGAINDSARKGAHLGFMRLGNG